MTASISGKIWRVKNIVGDKVTFDYCVILLNSATRFTFLTNTNCYGVNRKVLEIDSWHVA